MTPFQRLTDDLHWPALDSLPAFEAFVAAPGAHAVFIPGDRQRNLESADVAVILPELVMSFQGRFDAAVAGDAIEEAVRARVNSFQTPNILFFRDGDFIGDIPKVRDWTDYIARVTQILGRRPTPGADPAPAPTEDAA